MDMPEKIKLFVGECNTYFIDDNVKVLIDAGFDYPGKVDMILLTHGHPDHVKFLKPIMDRNPKCAVFMNIKEVELLIRNKVVIDDRFKALYEGKTKLNSGKYNFEVIDVPAHTKGSVAFYDEANKVLFSGDTIFKDGVGRTDLPESIPDFIDTAVTLLMGLESDIVLPGHGEPFVVEAPSEAPVAEDKPKKKAKK